MGSINHWHMFMTVNHRITRICSGLRTLVFGITPIVPNARERISEVRDQDVGAARAAAERGRAGMRGSRETIDSPGAWPPLNPPLGSGTARLPG